MDEEQDVQLADRSAPGKSSANAASDSSASEGEAEGQRRVAQRAAPALSLTSASVPSGKTSRAFGGAGGSGAYRFSARPAPPPSAAGARDDRDEESYSSRQKAFKASLKDFCKGLRKGAKEDAKAAAAAEGRTASKAQLTAAANAFAVKKSYKAPLGPGPPLELPGGILAPYYITAQLLDYQVEGLKWLAGLRAKGCGGILGDEMGLGKTVQVAALLGSLVANDSLAPSLVVCPATLIAHWQRELTVWWPPIRVLVLHGSSGGWEGGASTTSMASLLASAGKRGGGGGARAKPPPHVFLMTYEGLRANAAVLSGFGMRWGYIVLDEGHKIRNPDTSLTVIIKALPSPNRIVLSGSPVQNRLKELWSLVDFAVPGRLGCLPVFETQFAAPIAAGGWKHSTPAQALVAYECAKTLRQLIAPYLLRRLKKDVNKQLPPKTEQVLLVRMTASQRAAYAAYLRGAEVARVLDGRSSAFKAITVLRKLANHPWIAAEGAQGGGGGEEEEQGLGVGLLAAQRGRDSPLLDSGKMHVLAQILEKWHKERRRCLIFTQGVAMLTVIQHFAESMGYRYLRMDGSTAIGSRQVMVDEFNSDPTHFLFLLTTRVGGVGVNLIGADRVLIYDPDWNPSTDAQARERAWRLGQRRHVIIYRLITKGTVEERIYHRQVYKGALTAKVLVAQKRGEEQQFTYERLKELFTLTDEGDGDARGEPAGIHASLLPPEDRGAAKEMEDRRRNVKKRSGMLDGRSGGGGLEFGGGEGAVAVRRGGNYAIRDLEGGGGRGGEEEQEEQEEEEEQEGEEEFEGEEEEVPEECEEEVKIRSANEIRALQGMGGGGFVVSAEEWRGRGEGSGQGTGKVDAEDGALHVDAAAAAEDVDYDEEGRKAAGSATLEEEEVDEEMEEGHTSMLRSLIDARGGSAPHVILESMAGLSANERTLAMAHGERVAREALRSVTSATVGSSSSSGAAAAVAKKKPLRDAASTSVSVLDVLIEPKGRDALTSGIMEVSAAPPRVPSKPLARRPRISAPPPPPAALSCTPAGESPYASLRIALGHEVPPLQLRLASLPMLSRASPPTCTLTRLQTQWVVAGAEGGAQRSSSKVRKGTLLLDLPRFLPLGGGKPTAPAAALSIRPPSQAAILSTLPRVSLRRPTWAGREAVERERSRQTLPVPSVSSRAALLSSSTALSSAELLLRLQGPPAPARSSTAAPQQAPDGSGRTYSGLFSSLF